MGWSEIAHFRWDNNPCLQHQCFLLTHLSDLHIYHVVNIILSQLFLRDCEVTVVCSACLVSWSCNSSTFCDHFIALLISSGFRESGGEAAETKREGEAETVAVHRAEGSTCSDSTGSLWFRDNLLILSIVISGHWIYLEWLTAALCLSAWLL